MDVTNEPLAVDLQDSPIAVDVINEPLAVDIQDSPIAVDVINEPLAVDLLDSPVEVEIVKDSSTVVLGFSSGQTSGMANGIGGLHAMCQSSFGAAARVCNSADLIGAPTLTQVPLNRGWIQPIVQNSNIILESTRWWAAQTDISGVTRVGTDFNNPQAAISSASLSCNEWRSAHVNFMGLGYLYPNQFNSGGIRLFNCDRTERVLCCSSGQ